MTAKKITPANPETIPAPQSSEDAKPEAAARKASYARVGRKAAVVKTGRTNNHFSGG